MGSASEASHDPCPTCGYPAIAAYCSACGEKRLEEADWSLSRIGGEAFAEIIDLEHSKVWQTLRLLLFKPGQLTRDYWQGRRKPFLGPLKLYFIFFALSLVLYSIHQPTAVYDVRTLAAANPDGNLPRLLQQRAAQHGISTEQLAQEVNARWKSYISLSQLAYPFCVALALKLLFRRRRLYFTQHLVFAFHLLAFTFLTLVILWPIYVPLGIKPTIDRYTPGYLLLSTASVLWTITYLFLALRRAYAERPLAAAIKAAVLFITYFAASLVFLSATIALAFALSRGG